MSLSERDELYSAYSDGYKDLYGVRPRHVDPAACSLDELREKVQGVYEELSRELAWEREEAEAWWAEADAAREEAEATPDEFPSSGEGWAFTPAEG